MVESMSHLILLGDSILDNAAYTEGGPDVVSQVRALNMKRGQATLWIRSGFEAPEYEGSPSRHLTSHTGKRSMSASHPAKRCSVLLC